ncbi:uncharacterized protein LOC116591803 isoform X3 [Mustela erminea]|uniref:uncharacterized protein LOC116591803 isoform X3 n=1 Tax=Mustela erminea TaxID=36723 RepID=UPI0013872495|nr:uncharacterized protein LOC116591803 isoform X3 [Mustela erminea]
MPGDRGHLRPPTPGARPPPAAPQPAFRVPLGAGLGSWADSAPTSPGPPSARRPPQPGLAARRSPQRRWRVSARRPSTGFSFSPGRARGGPTPDARWHREAGPSGMAVLEQMEGWSLSLSCVKTSSANWLTLNGETGRTTHVFHFGFESQKTGFLQKPFGFNKCSVLNVNGSKPNTQDFCIRSRSEGLHFQVLREYLKLDSKARFTTNFEVEGGYLLLIWMLLSKFLQPWHTNIRKHGIVAITESQ